MRVGWLAGSPLLLVAVLAQGQSNSVPFLNQPLVPASTAPGGPALTLAVSGTGFASTSVVNWNGAPLQTKFVSASQLTATIPAANIVNPTTASITVISPASAGGTSNAEFFQVSPAATPGFTIYAQPAPPQPDMQIFSSQVFVDVNGDGKIDAVGGSGADMSLLLGRGDGSFETPQVINLGQSSNAEIDATVVGDFNHDGKLDFAFGNAMGNTVSTVLGNGDGTFGSPSLPTIATGYVVNYMAVGDFNHDGKLDLLTGNNLGPFSGVDDGTVSILLGNGDGTFQSHVDYQVGNYLDAVVVGDLNGDGNLDLVAATSAGNAPGLVVLLGNGDGSFGSPSVTSLGFQVNQLLLADVKGDSKPDLLTVDVYKPGHLYVFLGNGDGTFQSGVAYPTLGDSPLNLTSGDFNADGKLDIAAGNTGSQTVAILFGNGDGTFQTAMTYPSGAMTSSPLFAADFNGDGKLDLFDQPSNSNNTAVVLLQGNFPLAGTAPGGLSFPQQGINSTSPAQSVTLSNSGNAALAVSSITIGGSNAGDYAQSNNCGTSVGANATCQISVTFTPSALGTRNAILNISDNAPGSPQTVNLTGVTPAAPVLTLSPASITFPGQYVGTSGLPQTVTATNTGSAALSITSVATSSLDFGVLNACGSSLAAGASCSIGVFFDPAGPGARSGTLNLVDNASGGQQAVALSGMGQDFSFLSSSGQVTVSPGSAANFNLKIDPMGGFNQTVALSCSGAPAGSTCTLSANSLSFDGSTPVSFTATVTTLGNSAGGNQPARPWTPDTQIYFAICGLPGLLLLGSSTKSRKRRMWVVYGMASLALGCGVIAGCGGGKSSSSGGAGTTPAGNYIITVTGTYSNASTNLTHSTMLTMTVQ
jgi:FG-GAP-like repeat